jgi:hypothetical protein
VGRYIVVPLETDVEDILANFVAFVQNRFPGWQPLDGELDTAVSEAYAAQAADNRDLVTQVMDSIFRYFGASLIGVPPLAAASATTTTTWHLTDTNGHTIPAGTQVSIFNSSGDAIPFVTINEVVVPPGANTTATGEVVVSSLQPGQDNNGLGGVGDAVQLEDVFPWVTSIAMTAATSGGADDEDDDAYLNRLSDELRLGRILCRSLAQEQGMLTFAVLTVCSNVVLPETPLPWWCLVKQVPLFEAVRQPSTISTLAAHSSFLIRELRQTMQPVAIQVSSLSIAPFLLALTMSFLGCRSLASSIRRSTTSTRFPCVVGQAMIG